MSLSTSPAPSLNDPAVDRSNPPPRAVNPSHLPVTNVRAPSVIVPAPGIAAALGPAPALPHWFRVFYVVIKDTDGRDKMLKFLQYGFRYLRWLLVEHKSSADAALRLLVDAFRTLDMVEVVAAQLPPVPTAPLESRLRAVAVSRLELWSGSISQARKVIRLFKWCYTLPIAFKNYHRWRADCAAIERGAQMPSFRVFGRQHALPLWSTLELANNCIAILTDMSEDCDWYSRNQVLPERWNPRFARATIVLWSITVIGDLTFASRALMAARAAHSITPTKSSADSVESAWLSWLKFAADFGVALPSYLRQQQTRDGLIQFMGAASAGFATYKLMRAVN